MENQGENLVDAVSNRNRKRSKATVKNKHPKEENSSFGGESGDLHIRTMTSEMEVKTESIPYPFAPESFSMRPQSLHEDVSFGSSVLYKLHKDEIESEISPVELFLFVMNSQKMVFFKDESDYRRRKKPVVVYSLLEASYELSEPQKFGLIVHTNVKEDVILYCQNAKDFNGLITCLQFRGVTPQSQVFQLEDSHSRIESWTCEDVLQWSSNVLIGESYDGSLYDVADEYIQANNISGRTILSWNNQEIDKFIRSFNLKSHHKRNLKRNLKRMIKTGVYDPKWDKITSKVVNLLRYKNPENPIRVTEVNRIRMNMSHETLVRDRLLMLMYGGSDNVRSKKFRLKLNVVENLVTKNRKVLRKGIGRLLEIKDSLSCASGIVPGMGVGGEESSVKFGMYHTSITIGNLQLEWVNTELVIFRSASSSRALLSVDIGDLVVMDGRKFASDLAEFIVFWNGYCTYHSRKSSKTKGNCQTFIQRLLSYLQIFWTLDPLVEKFIKRMKYRGSSELQFDFDRKFADLFFQKKFKKLRRKKLFIPKTHQELDEFMEHLFDVCPRFVEVFPSEFALLKIFDRTYWLRFRSERNPETGEYPKNSPNAPLTKKGCTTPSCPFVGLKDSVKQMKL